MGVGWEYGFAPNWSAGIEYDHLFMGHANNSFTVGGTLASFVNDRVSQDVDMVTVRVNYRFGWGTAPVVSKSDLDRFRISTNLGRQKCRPYVGGCLKNPPEWKPDRSSIVGRAAWGCVDQALVAEIVTHRRRPELPPRCADELATLTLHHVKSASGLVKNGQIMRSSLRKSRLLGFCASVKRAANTR